MSITSKLVQLLLVGSMLVSFQEKAQVSFTITNYQRIQAEAASLPQAMCYFQQGSRAN